LKIKWGVIGCGGIAYRRTIPGMMLSENSELVAVMDTNFEAAEKVKEGFRASMQDVLNSIRDFGMNFVINLPYIIRFLVVAAIIIGINYAIVRIIIAVVKKNVLKKRAKKAAAEAAKASEETKASEAVKASEKTQSQEKA